MRPAPLAATLLSLALAAGFGWIAARPWLPAGGAPPPPPPDAAPPARSAAPFTPGGAPEPTDLAAFTRRPLFSAARRPPPPDAPGIALGGAAAPDLLFGRYEVAGVVMSGDAALALLRDADGALIRLREGDRLPAGGPGGGDAEIIDISLDSLTFAYEGATVAAPIKREGAKAE